MRNRGDNHLRTPPALSRWAAAKRLPRVLGAGRGGWERRASDERPGHREVGALPVRAPLQPARDDHRLEPVEVTGGAARHAVVQVRGPEANRAATTPRNPAQTVNAEPPIGARDQNVGRANPRVPETVG